jgi:hypothetical protein
MFHRQLVLLLALLATTLDTSAAVAQQKLFPDRRVKPEFTRLDHPFYRNAQYFVQQTGYEALWRRYDGYLPTGKGVVVAQCENGLADPAEFPGVEIVHVPGLGEVKWEKHSGTVGQILYGPQPFQDKACTYERSFSPGVRTVFAYRGDDFRKHVLRIEKPNTRGPELPAWPDAKRPVDVLNISNTLGNGGEDQTIRAVDYLIDRTDVLACTAQPGSLRSNASLSGNLWNSLVVGKASPDFGYAEGTDYENIGGSRRRKPDLVACSWISKDGGASSWSAPVVASAAALLIERARAADTTRRARRNFVLKAILMAGAAKAGMFSPVYDEAGKLKAADMDKPWVWSRTPEVPLDKLFGAGCLNVDNSYRILEAGEATEKAGPVGWVLGEGVSRAQPHEVSFVVEQPARDFTAALVWNRHVTAPRDGPYSSTVANLRLELRDPDGQAVQWSDDPGNNVEYLRVDGPLGPGVYRLVVTSASDEAESFGLAWHSFP